ncbi:MAG: flagellar protein FlaG [Candidatus Nitrohelix vancouverensis]|uniref:Flagellar protein FlaG n=1 Tax=Candidatus Nitrohelix vancouverensis TaxID=2705534 RepID=A0A7T0C212_9BACT|nr:MAG: flagellar protein FlaG [Candidatus Nitrohelix vancouverensis]
MSIDIHLDPAKVRPKARLNVAPSKEISKNEAVDVVKKNRLETEEAPPKAVDSASKVSSHSLDYLVSEETRQVVVKVVDEDSGETIKQIPDEDHLQLAKRIADFRERHFDIEA